MTAVDLFENFRSLLSENFDFLYLRINGYQLILDAVLLILFLYVFFRKPKAKPEKPLTQEASRHFCLSLPGNHRADRWVGA